jgi:hypothetical protein
MTFIPSVFPKVDNVFDPKDGVKIFEAAQYKTALVNQINNIVRVNRPVLVFFENSTKLYEFKNSEEAKNIQLAQGKTVEFLTEEANTEEKDRIIKSATS